jgi:3-deoxy-D-manno-octulosonic-acid transferase
MIHLLKDPEKMQRMGDTARQLVESSRGALDRALAAIASYLAQHLGGPAR